MTILQLMPQFPFPATDGGKVGIANITKQFALAGHRVIIVCNSQSASAEAIKQASQYASLQIVDCNTHNSVVRIAASVFSNKPLYISKQDNPAIRSVIDACFSENKVDVIHADHTSMAPLALWASKKYSVPWGLRLHNIEHLIWKRYAERLSVLNPKRWYLHREYRKLFAEEMQAVGQASVVFPITSADEDVIKNVVGKSVVVPAGVNADEWNVSPTYPSKRVVMASTFGWVHNADALRWFLETVWPNVLQRVPDATFHVCGSNVPTWVNNFKHQSVVVQGFVPSLAEFYATCTVSVSPLFVGSGMRLKIIEAMAAGLPVVATSIGAEGITSETANGLWVEDDAQAQADAIVGLLQNQELWQRASEEARAMVTQKYSWKAAVQLMIDQYSTFLP